MTSALKGIKPTLDISKIGTLSALQAVASTKTPQNGSVTLEIGVGVDDRGLFNTAPKQGYTSCSECYRGTAT